MLSFEIIPHSLFFFSLAFTLALLSTKITLRIFPKINLLDFPHRYGLKRKPIPYPGGLIFLLLFLGIFWIDPKFLPLIIFGSILGLLSFWDDKKSLPSSYRLCLHILIAISIFFLGIRIDFIGNPFAKTNLELYEEWPFSSFLLTIFWIVALQNAMNWFDGLKGLSVGISGIGFLTLGILGLIRPELFLDPQHATITQVNLYLSGLCFGAFYFFWKGKILLGDTGSQLLGFLLATMSIFSGAKIATTLLVLMLPLLDFVIVILRRLFVEKKSPFTGDLKHLHHNLARNIGEKKAVLYLIGISFVFGSIAIFFTGILKALALILTAFFTLGIMIFIKK